MGLRVELPLHGSTAARKGSQRAGIGKFTANIAGGCGGKGTGTVGKVFGSRRIVVVTGIVCVVLAPVMTTMVVIMVALVHLRCLQAV